MSNHISVVSNETSVMRIFQRGSAVARWCEDVIVEAAEGDKKHERWIAESYNTITNAAFVVASLVWIYRWVTAKERPLNFRAILLRESCMAGIGLGSAWFHAHQSLFAQYSDEIPMNIVMLISNHTALHPWLLDHPENRKIFHALNYSFMAIIWTVYFITGEHIVFLTGFAVQVIQNLAMSLDTARLTKTQLTYFWYGVGCLIVGKIAWQLERYRFRNDNCFAPGTLLLHPLWHIFAALYYYYSVMHWSEVEKRVRARRNQSKKKDL